MRLTQTDAPDGRQLIQSYRPGTFRVAGVTYSGSIIVTPEKTLPWAIASMAELTAEAFALLLEMPAFDVCLLGCGARPERIEPALRAKLKEAGLSVDAMDTGAAARTYNMLITEGRRAAAALIAL